VSGKTLVYADPPYINQAERHYSEHADYGGEVDHVDLLRRLNDSDGFVLHLSAPSTTQIARIMSEHHLCLDARWMSWVKPFAAFKRNVSVAYAWEPVLVRPVRKPVVRGRLVMRDWCSESITMRRGLSGAKPEQVCRWLFEVAGLEPDDGFVDLFPGTGAVTAAWERWRSDILNPGSCPSPQANRMSKLPKWAREHIAALEAELAAS
jgi:hypothetical protein